MEDRYIEILNKSSYHELTADEKEGIMELCSNEDEFENVKNLYREMESMGSEHYSMDSDSVKSLLDSEFKEVHGSDRGFSILKFLFPPLVPVYSKPGIQLAFLLVCIVSIYLSFQKVSIEPTKHVRYAQNNEQISKEKSTEELELKKEESSSELSSNLNAVPESPPSPMEEIVALEEEVIVEMEAPHFDVASRAHLYVSDARSFVADDVEEDSGFFDEADFDGFVSEEGRFIIEPVGSHLELIEDLFVTF
jgi:hypothetical protein